MVAGLCQRLSDILVISFVFGPLANPHSFTAQAATLSLPAATDTQASVHIYSAEPAPTHVHDISPEVWLAANAQLTSLYPKTTPAAIATQHWPKTLTIKGETYTVGPGQLPALKTSSTHHTPATSKATPTMSTHRPTSSTNAALPISNLDAIVAVGSGIGLIALAVALMTTIFCALHRRKSDTGSFFKAARYSMASNNPMREKHISDAPLAPYRDHDYNDYDQHNAYWRDEEASPTPIMPSTIRNVDEAFPGPSYYYDQPPPHNRQSVNMLRGKRLVSSRQDTPPGLYGAQAQGNEAGPRQARAPGVLPFRQHAADPRTSGDTTPQGRPLTVVQSPPASSSGILESRGNDSQAPDPGAAPAAALPSYRERRPADLTLPTAAHRFQNHRLVPAVHFSPEVSPMGRLTPSPPRGTPSPHWRDQLTPLTAVHYPSWSEVSGFDFVGDEGFRPRPSRNGQGRAEEDGDDGWRPGRDSVFGRYEMG